MSKEDTPPEHRPLPWYHKIARWLYRSGATDLIFMVFVFMFFATIIGG